MTDALSVAQAALVKASEAMVQIAAHERECARRYEESAAQTVRTNEKLDTLIEQGGLARGRAEKNKELLGGIPNAFWVAVISLVSSAFVAGATFLVMKLKL